MRSPVRLLGKAWAHYKVHGARTTARKLVRWLASAADRRSMPEPHAFPDITHTPNFIEYSRPRPPHAVVSRGSLRPRVIVALRDRWRASARIVAETTRASGWEVSEVDSSDTLPLDPGRCILLLPAELPAGQHSALIADAQAAYVPVVAVISGPTATQHGRKPTENKSDARPQTLIHEYADFRISRSADGDWTQALDGPGDASPIQPAERATLSATLEALYAAYLQRVLPKFSIVTILNGEAAQLEPVLESYFRQSYEGESEIVFVDDLCPEDPVVLIEQLFSRARASGRFERLPTFRIVSNEANAENRISRNVGIANASGDVVVLVDADCMLNRDFLTRHADAHAAWDCEIVIGSLNIETNGAPGLETLERLERVPLASLPHAELRDPINPRSFLNCVTRNFSIRRSAIRGELFDPLFTCSRAPNGELGWDDVDMGYRLYLEGARIKFITGAVSVHISHPSSVPEHDKPVRSLRNFRRLFEKHQDLALVARRWALETYDRLRGSLAVTGTAENDETLWLDRLFTSMRTRPPYVRTKRPLRVLTYRWHVPHQYELYKLQHEFTLLTDRGSPITSRWNFAERPLPDNALLRPWHDVLDQDYDLAILHFDENVLSPENTNGVIGPDWGASFRWFRENLKLPMVAICHGTPQFFGQYTPGYSGADLLQVIEPARRKLVDYLGDILVVCNSHQAAREWQFRRSKVIWHGFDPAEFPPATYERGILSPLGPLTSSRPHYRGYYLYRQIFDERFPQEWAPSSLHVAEPRLGYRDNQYAIARYRNYVDEIHRYSVYFNPTLRSPMPRARGEPMMCGVVTVSARNHDVDMFIKNGVNGFYSNDPAELREYLLFLVRNPAAARRIGAAGRRTALDLFNHDRYLGQWNATIESILG